MFFGMRRWSLCLKRSFTKTFLPRKKKLLDLIKLFVYVLQCFIIRLIRRKLPIFSLLCRYSKVKKFSVSAPPHPFQYLQPMCLFYELSVKMEGKFFSLLFPSCNFSHFSSATYTHIYTEALRNSLSWLMSVPLFMITFWWFLWIKGKRNFFKQKTFSLFIYRKR